MNFSFSLILISFFITKLTAEGDDILNVESTIRGDDTTSTFFTTDMIIKTTTINPVTMIIYPEIIQSTNGSLMEEDDVANSTTTTDTIFYNDTIIDNNEKIKFLKNDIPQFLVLSTDEGRKIYYEIQQNTNMKKCNIDKVTALWAQEQGDNINNLYKEYIKKMDEERGSYKNYITTFINQLSEEAQGIHKKIDEILDNTNITKKEEDKLISNLLASVNQSVVKELTTLNYKQ